MVRQIPKNEDPQAVTLVDLPKSVALLLAKAMPAVRRVEEAVAAYSAKSETRRVQSG